jgi:hypothetical protein
MREAEVEASGRRKQKGLAVRRRAETPFGRRDSRRAVREARAQQSMRGDIGASIGFKRKTRRPRCFSVVEERRKPWPFIVADRREVNEGNIDEGGGGFLSSVDRRQETPSFF